MAPANLVGYEITLVRHLTHTEGPVEMPLAIACDYSGIANFSAYKSQQTRNYTLYKTYIHI